MNAVAKNDFTQALGELGQRLGRPRAILCVSAHWMTEGVWVTRMKNPRTIHDFHGFPKELFDVQYPAPGSREIAELIQNTVSIPQIDADDEDWCLDHGTWSVLKHMYPAADVPVVQVSLAMDEGPRFQFDLGAKLRPLRSQGILILGSGNIVHNLRRLDWSESAPDMPWAAQFDQWVKARIEAREFDSLIEDSTQSNEGKLAIPTWDHWYPLLTVLGASDPKDDLNWIYEGFQHGSISMRSFAFGPGK